MTLTPRERVLAQVRHRETEQIPYTIGFEGDVAERLDAYYGTTAWRGLLDEAIARLPRPELSVRTDGGPLYRDAYGSIWRTDRRPFHLVEPALVEPRLAGLSLPDLDTLFSAKWSTRTWELIERARDHYTVIGFGFGLFERTWTLRGFNEVLMDAAGDPGFYADLVGRVADHQLQIIERLLALPVDGIMFSDDWGYQRGVLLGPDRWRRFLKPHLARMYARVHQAGKHALSHCCGSVVEILPDLIEIGLDVLESVQPEAEGMDPAQLKRRFGSQITFWGGLGSQSVIPHGTPGQIRAKVAELCRVMGQGGGFILAPAKALQPETPTENAAAVVESFLGQSGVSLARRRTPAW